MFPYKGIKKKHFLNILFLKENVMVNEKWIVLNSVVGK